jgi:hypothetical protein
MSETPKKSEEAALAVSSLDAALAKTIDAGEAHKDTSP